MQISLNFQNSWCNLKIWKVCEQNCMWFFYYFYFDRCYDVLKSKTPCFSLNKNINFNNNKTESKMEHTTESFRETNWRWSFQEKKKCIFCNVYFARRKFLQYLCFISMYSVLNKRSEYIYFYKSEKHYFIHFCCLFLKLPEAFIESLIGFASKA